MASVGFIGMAVGASVGGLMADRVGRRQVFALTLLVYGVATGAAALSWSVGALLVFRFLIGLGLGAELPVASTLVSEFAPARIRGRVVVVLESFWAVGWLLAALIGYFVIPLSDDGWRWAFALGAVPALYSAFVRFGLPESVRFLERRGRLVEAEDTVRRFEAAAGVPSPGGHAADARRDCAGAGTGGAVGTRPAHGYGVPLAGVVRRELLLLRGLHLDPDDPVRLGDGPGALLRVHAGHHARAAARLRSRRGARGGVGEATDAVVVPGRLRGRG